MMKELSPSDVKILKVQPSQEYYKQHLTEDFLREMDGDNFTYFEGGTPKALVGMQTQWKGRAIVWAMIGNVSNWVKFHKEVLAIMNEYVSLRGIVRLEMTTEVGFIESERWAKMLGFKEESVLKKYGPDGKDHKMMVRIWIR